MNTSPLDQQAVLCYVHCPWAYFTTQPLDQQWGDDWNDAPYEYNAGYPYTYRTGSADEPYSIICVAYKAGLYTPDTLHRPYSPYSVEQINDRQVAWLSNRISDTYPVAEEIIEVWAGTTLQEFCQIVHRDGGGIWVPLV